MCPLPLHTQTVTFLWILAPVAVSMSPCTPLPMSSEPHAHLYPPTCCPVSWCSWLFSLQHPLPAQGGFPDLDIYLYNKPGGQGTGGKGKLQSLGLWALPQVQQRLFTFGLESLVGEEGLGGGLCASAKSEPSYGFLHRGCLHHSSLCRRRRSLYVTVTVALPFPGTPRPTTRGRV